MPENFGLWACGGLVWRNSQPAIDFGIGWYSHQWTYSIQDQISFPFILKAIPLKLGTFPAHQFLNPYLRYIGHK
jgi:hypothetical protein